MKPEAALSAVDAPSPTVHRVRWGLSSGLYSFASYCVIAALFLPFTIPAAALFSWEFVLQSFVFGGLATAIPVGVSAYLLFPRVREASHVARAFAVGALGGAIALVAFTVILFITEGDLYLIPMVFVIVLPLLFPAIAGCLLAAHFEGNRVALRVVGTASAVALTIGVLSIVL